jgi:hypothetical protein
MPNELKQLYTALFLPVVAGFIMVYLLDGAGLLLFDSAAYCRILAPSLFITAALFSLGLPILYRSYVAHKLRGHKLISWPEFIRFERHLICIALVTPYLALMALAFKVPGFHFAGIVLMALYAGYYFYPSQKRLLFEKQIFRINPRPGADIGYEEISPEEPCATADR